MMVRGKPYIYLVCQKTTEVYKTSSAVQNGSSITWGGEKSYNYSAEVENASVMA